jgi:2'-5' RNA ligase
LCAGSTFSRIILPEEECGMAEDRKTHKTAVVLIPSEAAWPPIQAIRRRHDRGFQRWMPHVTLLYPFRPRREFEVAAAHLARACQSIPAFELTLAAFDFFEQRRESYTLWLAPEPKEALIELQAALWEVFPDCDEVRRFESGFTPHLSVGQVRGRQAMEDLVSARERTWAPVRFRVSGVSLIWRADPPDDVFRVGHTIRLSSSVKSTTTTRGGGL